MVCKEEFWQAAVASAGIAAIIAIGWEIVEFVLDLILHNDPQHVLDTGVNDTMMDMIVCMVGALLLLAADAQLLCQRKARAADGHLRELLLIPTPAEEK